MTLNPDNALNRIAREGGTIYVIEGRHSGDPDVHPGSGATTDTPEYQFSNAPAGQRGFSEDYLDLAEGMRRFLTINPDTKFVFDLDRETPTERPGIDPERAEAVLRVTLSCVITAGLYSGPVTRETVAGLVRDWFQQGEDFNAWEDAIDSVDLIEVRNDSGPDLSPRFIVDGLESDDPDAAHQADGEFPPFVVFDIDHQQNLPANFPTREAAQEVADRMNRAVLQDYLPCLTV